VVLPITDAQHEYAREVYHEFTAAGIRAEFDERNEKIGYKIREWETKKIPYMLVIGDKERQNGTVAVRKHKHGDQGAVERAAFISSLQKAIAAKTLTT
jgi:threonyl-tRNA synthetase